MTAEALYLVFWKMTSTAEPPPFESLTPVHRQGWESVLDITKTAATTSVLRDWVMQLSYREQGTLLTAIRGCDAAPKLPLDSTERQLTAAVRYAVMIPADQREVDSEPGCFMVSNPPDPFRLSCLEHYPMHWITHVMHAAQIIGVRHPYPDVRFKWLTVYYKMVRGMHLQPETVEHLTERMLEDRIKNDSVVS